jgi:hypothetical protein
MTAAVIGASGGEESMFFFEKKNQKTFAMLAFALRLAYTPKSRSFLVLFFKKELLPSYAALNNSPCNVTAGRQSPTNSSARASGPFSVRGSSPGNAIARIRVAVAPGSNKFTRSFVFSTSSAQQRTSTSIAAFVAA